MLNLQITLHPWSRTIWSRLHFHVILSMDVYSSIQTCGSHPSWKTSLFLSADFCLHHFIFPLVLDNMNLPKTPRLSFHNFFLFTTIQGNFDGLVLHTLWSSVCLLSTGTSSLCGCSSARRFWASVTQSIRVTTPLQESLYILRRRSWWRK